MMRKKYVYMHHQGFDFYFTDYEKTPEECYCSYCEEYDEQVGVYEEEEQFAAKLKELFTAGYDVLPGDDYNEIRAKYCPPELRLWEERCELNLAPFCDYRAKEIYGQQLADKIQERLEWELLIIEKQKSELHFLVPMYLATLAREHGGMVGVRGCAAASFVAHLLGITEINPLDAHYLCDHCKYHEFPGEGHYYIGIDLPDRHCPICGGDMKKEGFHLRPEMLFGVDGEKLPDIDLLISGEIQPKLMAEMSGILDKQGRVTNEAIYLRSRQSQVDSSEENMIKFDVLPNDHLELLVKLRDKTGIDIKDISLNDKQVLAAIKTADTVGNAEYGSAFAREVIAVVKPTNFSDLIRVSGVLHGSGIWEDNVEFLLREGVAPLKDVISSRDDVYELLFQRGGEKEMAYKIMEFVRKGMFYIGDGVNETKKKAERRRQYSEILTEMNVPQWYIESLKKVWYAFPKAHAAEWARRYYLLFWYQKHFPEEYEQLRVDVNED